MQMFITVARAPILQSLTQLGSLDIIIFLENLLDPGRCFSVLDTCMNFRMILQDTMLESSVVNFFSDVKEGPKIGAWHLTFLCYLHACFLLTDRCI